MIIRLKLTRIRHQAETLGHPEVYEDYISYGKIDGDELIVDYAVREKMRKKYRPGTSATKPATPRPPIPSEPTLTDLAANFTTATAKWAASGFKLVSESEYQIRAAICDNCKLWNPTARLGLGKCMHKECGCTKFKRYLATENCPLGKWPAS